MAFKTGTYKVVVEAWNRFDEAPEVYRYTFRNHTFREAVRKGEQRADDIERCGTYKYAAVVAVDVVSKSR